MFKPGTGWDDGEFPSAYLITFRTYGTWLHGDERGSFRRQVDDKYHNRKVIPPNQKLLGSMRSEMDNKRFLLKKEMQKVSEIVISEVCEQKGYFLHAANARSNHIHTVISAKLDPDLIARTLKSYITRRLREKDMVGETERVWSRGNSCRYLWKPREVARAVEYVLYGQGDSFDAVTELPKD